MIDHWNLEPPPGFQGLHPERPITFYCRHLPHWRQDGATYFVTFRLGDSLPQSKLRELKRIKEQWLLARDKSRGASLPAEEMKFSSEEWEAYLKMVMQVVES